MGIRDNIIKLRKIFDVTQRELADVAGVTENAVSKWENGYAEPRMGAIERIAACYGLSKMNIIEDGGMDLIDPVTKKPRQAQPLPRGARRAQGMAMGFAPRLGRAHAGAFTEPEVFDEADMVQIPQFLLDDDPQSFVVASEGDCMDKVFGVGPDLVVSPNKQPKDGSIVLASIDGGDTIVRRMRRTATTLILSPESHNPEHRDIIITDDSGHTIELGGVITWYQSSREMD